MKGVIDIHSKKLKQQLVEDSTSFNNILYQPKPKAYIYIYIYNVNQRDIISICWTLWN